MRLTRYKFKTDAQYKRYTDIYEYVMRLQSLQEEGKLIYTNGEVVEGKFFSDRDGIGLYEDGCYMYLVGSEWEENTKQGEYDFLYINQTLKQFKKEYSFQLIIQVEDIQ